VLVLGSTGMLGHQIVQYLSKFDKYEIHDISMKKKLRQSTVILDVVEIELLVKLITRLKPEIIINCIGLLIKGSSNKAMAIYLNSLFPNQLKEIANSVGSKMIHISTDCVFSGYKGKYNETDYRDGNGVYAQTKILGEIIDDTNLTLRTSIVGPELKDNGEGLFHWFMSQSCNISGYTKDIWSGVTTLELAKAVVWSINEKVTGLYHITNNSSISKCELLGLFKKYSKKDIKIIPVQGRKTNKSLVDTRKLLNYTIPTYDIMIKDMFDMISRNRLLYSQYLISNHVL
jgi:dTDP-4-dehydrorhamnose reductase